MADNRLIKTDILIAGTGCSGLYMAMNLPSDKNILMITKSDCESSDSYLAQGGMCMLKSEDDYDSYFEDTLKAGHYENDKKSVEIMIRSSAEVVDDLVKCGASFKREKDGSLAYTREGAHSANRIIFHEDITGKEITSHLLAKVRTLPNVKIVEFTRLLDIISKDNRCLGAVIRDNNGDVIKIEAQDVVLATGGIGGLYRYIQRISGILQVMQLLLQLSMELSLKISIMCRYIQQHFTLRSRRTEAFLYQNQ